MAKRTHKNDVLRLAIEEIDNRLYMGSKMTLIYSPKQPADGTKVVLASTYQGYVGTDSILITLPRQGNEPYPLHVKDPVKVSFPDRKTVSSALYSFEAVVTQRLIETGVPHLQLQLQGELQRIQRRHDFRLPVSMQGVIEFTDQATGETKGHVVDIVDISGGGTGVQTNLYFDLGAITRVHVPIDGVIMSFEAEVCRCNAIDNPGLKFKYGVGLRFLYENTKEKEAVVKYVFRLQRESKRLM